jgi:hypothetical protein
MQCFKGYSSEPDQTDIDIEEEINSNDLNDLTLSEGTTVLDAMPTSPD